MLYTLSNQFEDDDETIVFDISIEVICTLESASLENDINQESELIYILDTVLQLDLPSLQ